MTRPVAGGNDPTATSNTSQEDRRPRGGDSGHHSQRRGSIIVTGMSGAGKTTALKVLEDLGYDSVDHLPLSLLARLFNAAAEADEETARPLAVGCGVRTRDFSAETFLTLLRGILSKSCPEATLLFLTCDDDELHRRYSATRHRHPLASERPLRDGIAQERQSLATLADAADLVLDTTRLSPGDLKTVLDGHFRIENQPALQIRVVSFSYRAGLLREADIVIDVRFLKNPYYDETLRGLTGRDVAVQDHIREDEGYEEFMQALTRLLEPLIPRYGREGKSYLTVAVGCTGGRHRSVFVAEQLVGWLHEQGQDAHVHHRDLANR